MKDIYLLKNAFCFHAISLSAMNKSKKKPIFKKLMNSCLILSKSNDEMSCSLYTDRAREKQERIEADYTYRTRPPICKSYWIGDDYHELCPSCQKIIS